MPYARIAGTGGYLPERVLSNADLEKMVDTSHEWIMKRAGIAERRIAEADQPPSFMAEHAAKAAIKAAGISPAEIDMIVVGVATPDKLFPSVACLLQQRLGINNECTAMDLNAACSGFIYSLSVADKYIRCGECKTVLVVGVEGLSRVTNWQDRSTCVLFGDGAGAVILQADEEQGVLGTQLYANGNYQEFLYCDNGLWEQPRGTIKMNGNETFKMAVSKLSSIVDEALKKNNVQKSDIDWLIPHQANLRIIKATAKLLSLPMERVILTLEQQGNTSAASVPLALDQAVRDGRIQRGQLILLEAFGAGFTWGSALIRY